MYESIGKNVLTVDRRSFPLSQLTVNSPGVNVSGAEDGAIYEVGARVGARVGSGALSVQMFPAFPFKHLVSPTPLSSPSITIYSVVFTVPVQSSHIIAEYVTPPSTEYSILPPQAFVSVLVT